MLHVPRGTCHLTKSEVRVVYVTRCPAYLSVPPNLMQTGVKLCSSTLSCRERGSSRGDSTTSNKNSLSLQDQAQGFKGTSAYRPSRSPLGDQGVALRIRCEDRRARLEGRARGRAHTMARTVSIGLLLTCPHALHESPLNDA